MNPKKPYRWVRLLIALGAVAALSCCSSDGGNNEPPPTVSVSISPPAASCKIGESCSFSATVSGTTNTAVTWSLSGTGCTGASCGTISSNGVYTAPDVVPVPAAVTVRATSQAAAGKSAVATVTIVSDVAVTVWPASAKVKTNDSYQFTQTLTGSSDTSVTWSVSGTGCTGSGCGTIDSSGLYTAPALVPTVAAVTVRATSVVDPGKSADASVTIGATGESKLAGSYAWFTRGVWSGLPAHLAGCLTMDGAGVIGEGLVDRTCDASLGGSLIAQPYTGFYSMWTENRGSISMVFPFGSVLFMHSLATNGDKGFLQPFYDVGVRSTGVLMKQDPAAFMASSIQGTYVFQWTGSDSAGHRIAEIGRFSADGAGVISGGGLDLNNGSTLIQGIPITGTYTVNANGRGTMALTMQGVGTFQFALYVVSAETLIVTSIGDPGPSVPMLIGLARRQSGGPFSDASLEGTHVFELTGRVSSTSAVATAGLAVSDGAGNLTGRFDRNVNNVVTADQPYTATTSIAVDGRGTIDSAALPSLIFYMVDPDEALLMEGAGGSVQTGTMERQVSLSYEAGTLVGQYAQGSSPPALVPSVTATAQVLYYPTGSLNALADVVSPCLLDNSSDGSLHFAVSSTGRFDLLNAGGGRMAGGYMISPLRYVLVLERASSGQACDEIVHLYRAER
jgi:hypothetical protein